MTECPNAMMRDLLPALLHERLDASRRREVEAHVSGCEACAAELQLLRAMRVALRRAPGIDIDRVAAAATRSARRPRSHWAVVRRRAAAAIAAIAVGGAGLFYAGRHRTEGRGPSARVAAAVDRDSGARHAPTPAAVADAAPVISTSGPQQVELRLAATAELADEDLRALLAVLAELDGIPAVEPLPIAPLVIEGTT